MLLAACNWQPHARDIQPQLLLSGPVRVQRLLDSEGRYALFTLGIGDALRYRILNADTHQSCELMQLDTPVSNPRLPLVAPNLKGDDVAKFWLPLLRRDPTADDDAPKTLFYSDDKCNVIGPFGLTSGEPAMIALRADKRNVSIVAGPGSTLSLVDPWTQQTRPLAANVTAFDEVSETDSTSAPEAMWLIESGKLTQRGLDGTLLLSLGSAVSEFQQNLLQGALRVAFTDGGSVFEAKGPSFVPVLIAADACNPTYTGTALDLHTPCSQQQLVRIDLISASIKRYSEGVYRAFPLGDINIEWVRVADGSTEWWVASGTTANPIRSKLSPTPVDAVSVLDHTHIAARTADSTFGIWDTTAGFTPAFMGVDSLQAFRDSRTNRLLWLMQYQVADNVGVVAGFDQTLLERVVAGTQLTPPTVLSAQVLQGGYRVFLPNILPEPMVLTYEQPIAEQADMSFSGQLNARLLSGSLASVIDEGVSSAEVALAPYPGILYGILEGPRSGLWFAAL